MSEVQKSTVYQKFSNGFKELCKNTRHIFSIRFSVFEMKIKFRKYSKKWSFWVFTIFENCQKSVDLSLFIKWKSCWSHWLLKLKSWRSIWLTRFSILDQFENVFFRAPFFGIHFCAIFCLEHLVVSLNFSVLNHKLLKFAKNYKKLPFFSKNDSTNFLAEIFFKINFFKGLSKVLF